MPLSQRYRLLSGQPTGGMSDENTGITSECGSNEISNCGSIEGLGLQRIPVQAWGAFGFAVTPRVEGNGASTCVG